MLSVIDWLKSFPIVKRGNDDIYTPGPEVTEPVVTDKFEKDIRDMLEKYPTGEKFKDE